MCGDRVELPVPTGDALLEHQTLPAERLGSNLRHAGRLPLRPRGLLPAPAEARDHREPPPQRLQPCPDPDAVRERLLEPPGWVSAHLSLDSTIDVSTLNLKKRPVKAYVDGVELGEVAAMKVRSSRTAAVELAFTPHHDMAEKLVHIQFPGT
jgi:hypothetical protein